MIYSGTTNIQSYRPGFPAGQPKEEVAMKLFEFLDDVIVWVATTVVRMVFAIGTLWVYVQFIALVVVALVGIAVVVMLLIT
jgi:hypothetical protein